MHWAVSDSLPFSYFGKDLQSSLYAFFLYSPLLNFLSSTCDRFLTCSRRPCLTISSSSYKSWLFSIFPAVSVVGNTGVASLVSIVAQRDQC